jgi:hypothetical protein
MISTSEKNPVQVTHILQVPTAVGTLLHFYYGYAVHASKILEVTASYYGGTRNHTHILQYPDGARLCITGGVLMLHGTLSIPLEVPNQ